MVSQKYYAVFKGRKTGIFSSWQECEEQVTGFSDALYKSFKTKGEAEAALELAKQTSQPCRTHGIAPISIAFGP